MAEKKKSKAGRPTQYKEEYCQLAKNYSLMGATDVEMAGFFNVSQQTLNSWKNKHSEFLESIKSGKQEADAAISSKLYHKAMGYSHPDTKFATHEGKITDREEYTKHHAPDTTALIFWLKNRQPDKWREKKEVEVSGSMIGSLIDEVQDESNN